VVRRLVAEFSGTAFLVAAVVGSGIMAERLSNDPGLQLLQNTAATAGVLVALRLSSGRPPNARRAISGSPKVSLPSDCWS
jgi:hypothetical protein